MAALPLAHLRVGILGLGVAGRAMAHALGSRGAQLVLADDSLRPSAQLQAQFPHAQWACQDVPDGVFDGCHRVLLSPGVPPGHRAIVRATAQGTAVVGEVEFIEQLAPGAVTLAITGTNGKSTTTSLSGALCHSLGERAFVGGNLGLGIGDWLAEAPSLRPRAALLELSSYQIDGLVTYRPDVAVVLNVTPDHLARYGTFERYLHSKSRLIAALPPDGTAVLNADDPKVAAMARLTQARVLWFTQKTHLPAQNLGEPSGMVVRHGCAVPLGAVAHALAPMALEHPTLIGAHNVDNTLAALLGVWALLTRLAQHAAPPAPAPQAMTAILRAAYLAYGGLPHRLAPVGSLQGVRYLNDSKATNDASAATAVRAMGGPFLLLVGGQDKGGGYADLTAALAQVPPKAIVAFGAARTLLSQALGARGASVHERATLEEACALAQSLAEPGDTVLLSPACTSFDAFSNYQHRGDAFAAWVATRGGA